MSTNLFIDKSQTPSKDQGIIDIGKNCQYCNQLDFLPFVCEFCKQTYCSNHRKIDQHNCINKHLYDRSPSRSASPGEFISSKTLFPDREADKKRIDQRLKTSPKPTTILETQFRVGDAARGSSNAFTKFQKFLNLQKSKQSKSVFKLFKSGTTATATSKYAEIATLKKQAKGDVKISASDRIYIYCIYINNPDEKIESSNKKPIFINKNWVIGKSLDSITNILSIKNNNNIVNNPDEKLNIFKLDDSEKPQLVTTSSKSNVFKNGEVLYLVRGSI
ncbi:CDC48-associated ubiquitin-like/zinc finger protein 1 [Spathaspora sp. JA1]|nr:CDC48-associated ubiquitin-like/zinc finger protein 1 [Spathaspora sp. JA1]